MAACCAAQLGVTRPMAYTLNPCNSAAPLARAEGGGDSGGSAAGGKNPGGGGVIRPTAMMPSQVTPGMMAEFMAKFGSMQAMAAKIEHLEARVADMKLVRRVPHHPLRSELVHGVLVLLVAQASLHLVGLNGELVCRSVGLLAARASCRLPQFSIPAACPFA